MGMTSILPAGTIRHPLGYGTDPAADLPDVRGFILRDDGSEAGQRTDCPCSGGIDGTDMIIAGASQVWVAGSFASQDLGKGRCHAVMLTAQPNPVINNRSAGFSL